MVNVIVRSMLGPWGSAVLDFYIQHSLWINLPLLLYALLVAVGRKNYSLFVNSLLADFRQGQAEKIAGKDRSQVLYFLKRAKLPWDRAMQAAWFPLLSPPGSIWFIMKRLNNLQRQFTNDKLLEILLK